MGRRVKLILAFLLIFLTPLLVGFKEKTEEKVNIDLQSTPEGSEILDELFSLFPEGLSAVRDAETL